MIGCQTRSDSKIAAGTNPKNSCTACVRPAGISVVGEVVSVEKVPVTFTVKGGHGTIKLGDAGYAELEPYKSASGHTTTLTDTVFSTVPGAPVFVGKATRYRSKNDKVGIDLDIKGHNALQSTFVFNA